jgi:hypothetical protein
MRTPRECLSIDHSIGLCSRVTTVRAGELSAEGFDKLSPRQLATSSRVPALEWANVIRFIRRAGYQSSALILVSTFTLHKVPKYLAFPTVRGGYTCGDEAVTPRVRYREPTLDATLEEPGVDRPIHPTRYGTNLERRGENRRVASR